MYQAKRMKMKTNLKKLVIVLSNNVARPPQPPMWGSCTRGGLCPFQHVRGNQTIVCKHWQRGLCKKGDQCKFLHKYDMKKMTECYFYSRFNACHNKEWSIPAHLPWLNAEGLPLVWPRFLPPWPALPKQTCASCALHKLLCWLLSWRRRVETHASTIRAA